MKNNIQHYRKASGLTQKEVGERVGVSGGAVSAWECGRTEPTIEQSFELANIFGCTVVELFGKPDDKQMARIKAYAAKIAELPEAHRKAVENLIDSLS